MMQMPLVLTPKQGRQDLAWLARTTGDLTEIYDFLLHAQLNADITEEPTRPLTESELKAAVDGRAVQVGTPLVQASAGSMVLQLSQYVDATVGVQILAALGLLLKKGPDIAAFPNKLRKAWYSSAEDALSARNAYERLKRESVISVDEPLPSNAAAEQEILAQVEGRAQKGEPPVARRAGRSTDLRP
jgi:hypothetical protein